MPGAWPEGTPSITEAYAAMHGGAAPSGDWWDAYVWYRNNIMSAVIAVTAPPGVNEATLETLQQAFQDTVTDETFLTEYRATIGEVPYYNSTAQTEAIFAGLPQRARERRGQDDRNPGRVSPARRLLLGRARHPLDRGAPGGMPRP